MKFVVLERVQTACGLLVVSRVNVVRVKKVFL